MLGCGAVIRWATSWDSAIDKSSREKLPNLGDLVFGE
jgi:hypothetical protein